MTIEIPLSRQGKYKGIYKTLIDDCDSDLADFRWQIKYSENQIMYVYGRLYSYSPVVRIHRIIMERILGRPMIKGEEVDHINRNGLDNRRENLRVATRSQNNGNQKIQSNNKSGYKGVNRIKNKWEATIQYKKKRIRLGHFDTPQEAHEAYCQKAKELFGEFFYDGKER